MALNALDTGAQRGFRLDAFTFAAAAAALICALPALAVLALSLRADSELSFGGDLLRDGAIGTAALALLGGGGAIIIGAIAAALVSLTTFPGRRIFEFVLVAPLAAPAFVLAYSYTGLTWANASPVEVRGLLGCAFIYAIGLYPYVYLAARASFATQSAAALDAARTLGVGGAKAFWRVALPLARPGIIAGGALALMEIAADYGAAQHFGLTTLTTAVFRAWTAHQSLDAAMQISAVLLLAALVFLIIERHARERTRFAAGGASGRAPTRARLPPLAAIGAFLFCASLAVLGVVLPLGWLVRLAVLHGNPEDLTGPLLNSLTLACAGAALTLALAAAIAAAARRSGAVSKLALLSAGIGYAAPGAVLAMSALAIFQIGRELGWLGGLSSGVALAALFWAYASRFAAAGVQPIDAGLARLSRGIDAAAKTLGAKAWRRFWQIDLPIAAPSLAAAALILFVEILKELPATLILRPFNFDTLAVRAYAYASDERLLEAAAPALVIFLAGLAPILLLNHGIGRATGART